MEILDREERPKKDRKARTHLRKNLCRIVTLQLGLCGLRHQLQQRSAFFTVFTEDVNGVRELQSQGGKGIIAAGSCICPPPQAAELQWRVFDGVSKAALVHELGISRDRLYRYIPVKQHRTGGLQDELYAGNPRRETMSESENASGAGTPAG
jgi:hypothetical protein